MANVVVGATLFNSRQIPFGNASIWGSAPTFYGVFPKFFFQFVSGVI